ncbi:MULTISPECIES: hydroxymethylglutaryl-CoA lyase [Anaerotruncus]|uniref:hydroxymethylglutaryl-CoA lyase n=1 Tax=Anaerotruncus TaxID=244127 RepID=UPI000E47B027|nr:MULTISPECIES: hydroxymethylglutaryl-CoA lyase [Anaerotruncus]RGX55638.1 hydroxymethylglutaryl-CoA lyase [Anaerotruncus sp. AF02-27]
MKGHIQITEVAPRDGFQILPRRIPLAEKITLIEKLIRAGCEEIEAASFVSPKWVLQMADSAEICKAFAGRRETELTYLVPNLRGAQLAVEAGARQLFVTTSASDKHSRENLNQTIEEVLAGAKEIARLAYAHGVTCTASIAAAFGYSPDPHGVSREQVCSMAKTLADAGFSALTLCDTSGEADPDGIAFLCDATACAVDLPLGVHLHQAGGIEYANALAALQSGVRIFEAAVGGLGGCPYIKKAKGNIATETLVRMFHAMGYETGIDLKKLEECAARAKALQAAYGTPACADNCAAQ